MANVSCFSLFSLSLPAATVSMIVMIAACPAAYAGSAGTPAAAGATGQGQAALFARPAENPERDGAVSRTARPAEPAARKTPPAARPHNQSGRQPGRQPGNQPDSQADFRMTANLGATSGAHPGAAQDAAFRAILQGVYDTNPTLLAARDELSAVRELYPQASANWKPSVTAGASLDATSIDNSNFRGADGATTKDMNIVLDQPIYRGGRTMAEMERALEDIRAQEARLFQAEQVILLDAIQASLDVARDRRILALRAENEKNLEGEVTGANERLKAGAVTLTDVRQAESRLARAQADRIAASGQLETSKAVFEQITGALPPQGGAYPADFPALPATLDEIIGLADMHNPDIDVTIAQYNASQHHIDTVLGERYPVISAYASYDQQYDPQPGLIDDSSTEAVGLRATLPLYRGGATMSRVREARHLSSRREHQIEETRRRVRQNVISLYRTHEAENQNIKARRAEIRAAQLALDGVMEEARLGARTVLDTLDANQELIEAKAALTMAERNNLLSLYTLSAQMGRLTPQNLGLDTGLRPGTAPGPDTKREKTLARADAR